MSKMSEDTIHQLAIIGAIYWLAVLENMGTWKEKCKFAVIDANGRQTCTHKTRSKNYCKGKDRFCNIIPKPIAFKTESKVQPS